MNATSAENAAALAVAPAGPALVEPRAVILENVESTRPQDRYSQLRRRFASADVVAGALSGLVVAWVAGVAAPYAALVVASLAVAWPLCGFFAGLYAASDLRAWASGVAEAPRLVLAALLLSWPVYGGITLLGRPSAGLAALVASSVTALTASIGRAAARVSVHRAPELREQTLVIGSGEVAMRVTDRLRNHDEIGLDVIGYLDTEEQQFKRERMRWLGGLDALGPLIRAGSVDRVIIAFSRVGHHELLNCIRVCRDAGITVDIVPRLFDFLDGARVLDQVGGMPLLSIGAPRFSRTSQIAKRALDIVGASLALIVLAPLMLAIALAIKLDSRGPVLFVQRRPGRRAKLFPVYKFRSMVHDAGIVVDDGGRLVKLRADGRVTRVGRLIRRLSLDEAPQILNVLRGDMSLVGPRPIVAAEADALTEAWQARRSDLRPGLTGPWQISGRSHIPFEERLMLDYQYVAGWSLARDVEILLATVPAILSGRGAY